MDAATEPESAPERRAADLPQADTTLVRTAVHLETTSRVGQQLTTLVDPEDLLGQVVVMIQGGFGYRFVGAWRVTEKGDCAVLSAAAGQAGDAPGLRLPLDSGRAVTEVCRTGNEHESAGHAADPQACAELILPLRLGDKVMGALELRSDRAEVFTRDERLVLQMLAGQIAIAVRNAQLYEREQTRRHLAESLEEIGRELSSSLDLEELPGRILERLATVVPYERCSVMLQDGPALRIAAQRGFPDEGRAKDIRIEILPDDIYLQLVDTRRPLWLDDVTQVPGWRLVEWLAVNRSWLGAPLIVKDRVIGMISVTRREAAAFTADDALLASAFASQAAIALENARLYGELNRAYATLEQLDKTKSRFIEIAGHELRTPLTVIKGYTQVLQTLPVFQGDEQARTLLDGTLSGVSRLYEIVNSMLDVSKIDSRTLQVHFEPIWIGAIVMQVCANFAAAMRERNLTLITWGLEDLPRVEADGDLLLKLFSHLIVNAIKYTPDEGSITVTGTVVDENAVEIVVIDTGIGIDAAHQELIFERFYQTGEVSVHSSGKTKFKGGGPGLGLAIARGVVQAHGGRIWVESEGHDETRCPGSRFHVRLPLRQA